MQHEHHRVPVTAISLWRQHVQLFAQGPLLKAYDLKCKTLLAVCRVFESQAIHGIIWNDDTHESHVLVWGGRWVRLIHLKHLEDRSVSLELGTLLDANDWVLDGAFSSDEENYSPNAVLITAHNALLFVQINGLDMGMQTLIPGSNCILYSAHASWLSPFKCLIASGTAFGDIIIWSCTISSGRDRLSVNQQTHFTFLAHNGSVFGLQLASPAVAAALGGRRHVLASCSDDRTVSIWDISDLTAHNDENCAKTERQTGFGHELASESCAPPLLGKAMGHLSRIWHVRFNQPLAGSDTCRIATFGEDATTITWAMEANIATASSPFTIRQIQTERYHSGKNLWAVTMDEVRRVTGGSDGAITWRDIEDPPQVMEVNAVTSDCQKRPDHYRAYGFVGRSQVVATTDHGRVVLMERTTQGNLVVKDLSSTLQSLRGYSILATLGDIAFFAGADGVVYSYKSGETDLQTILTTGRKVAGLFAQTECTSSAVSTNIGTLLVANVGSTTATVCRFDLERGSNYGTKLDVRALELPDGIIVTSLARFSSGRSHITAIGSRSGKILIFSKIQGSTAGSTLTSIDAHHGESVTSLTPVSHFGHDTKFMLYSTGRDGTYAAHLLTVENTGQVLVSLVHQLSPLFGSNIEGIGHAPSGMMFVWGFRSTEFVVFNVNTQQEVMKVDCGGVHRTWCFSLNNEGGVFVWTKASKMYWKTQTELPFHSLNAGGHGREIKSAAVSPSNARLIATGAEDTAIKLTLYDGSFRCLHTLQKHNTGIQHLQWSADGRLLFSSGGFEEFFVWRITHQLPGLDVGVVCESKHPQSGRSDLRIMHFDVRDEAAENPTGMFRVTMIYSDSSMRIWRYENRSWLLVTAGNYLTSCLTQMIHLAEPSHVITGSTDGHLVLWEQNITQDELTWRQRYNVHQNAILCMVKHEPRPGCNVIVTGGDDNAIGITRISEATDSRTLIVPKAHAAAVTAITVISCHPDCLWFVSASIDQRIKLWRVEMDLDRPGIEGIDIRLVQNVFTPVADVSSIDKISTSNASSGILVCGVGMDIWRVDVPKA